MVIIGKADASTSWSSMKLPTITSVIAVLRAYICSLIYLLQQIRMDSDPLNLVKSKSLTLAKLSTCLVQEMVSERILSACGTKQRLKSQGGQECMPLHFKCQIMAARISWGCTDQRPGRLPALQHRQGRG